MGMEMSCSECGGKSPMGAIFCRECGAKLELDDLEPDVIVKSTDGGFKFTRLAIRRLISLVVIIALVGVVLMLLADESPGMPDEVSDAAIDSVSQRYNYISKAGKKKIKKMKLNEDALTYYMQQQLDTMQSGQEGDATMLFNKCVFDFYDDNMVKIDMQATMNIVGMKNDFSMQMIFSIDNSEEGVTFTVESCKHGSITLPVLQDKLVISRFERLIPAGDDLNTIIEKIQSVTIVDDSDVIIELK